MSLAQRTGAESTSACVQALHSSSGNLQGLGARLLAEYGDGSAGGEVLSGWTDV